MREAAETGGRFAESLDRLLPSDLPNRANVVHLANRHLELVAAANHRLNLTAIRDDAELVIKHALDSLLPWRELAHASTILDLGSGAGFPGVPLALALAETRVVLVESVQKKAAFLTEVRDALAAEPIPRRTNVEVVAARAELVLAERSVDVVVARAVAPIERLLRVLRPVHHRFKELFLYKGPRVGAELEAARPLARRLGLSAELVGSRALPSGAGTRTFVRLAHA